MAGVVLLFFVFPFGPLREVKKLPRPLSTACRVGNGSTRDKLSLDQSSRTFVRSAKGAFKLSDYQRFVLLLLVLSSGNNVI